MFAAREQENLIHGHQQLAASKPLNQGARGLQPKTPGNKYPKTPLRIPLNDENAVGTIGGKGKGLENLVTGGKKATFDKNAFVTPLATRVRAPLGAKTTNAKAKAFQTPMGTAPDKEAQKTRPQASTRKPKNIIHADTTRVEVLGHESPLRADRDVEYAPPRPQDLPHEFEDFPSGCLNYEPLKKGNLTRGIHRAYYMNVDEDGLSEADRKWEDEHQKSIQKIDDAIMKSLEEDLKIEEVSETSGRHQSKAVINRSDNNPLRKGILSSVKAPPTVTSRKAVSALGLPARQREVAVNAKVLAKPKPSLPFLSRAKPVATDDTVKPSTMRHNAAIAASKSTLGYSKGRSASGIIPQKRQGGMTRSVSNLSQTSDVTITPARFAQQEERESKRLPWLAAFEADDELGLKGRLPDCLTRTEDDDEEEFVLTLGP